MSDNTNKSANLRKLAKSLRLVAADIEGKKQEKLANITLAMTALELLRRKTQ